MRSLVILLNAANSTDIEFSEKLHTTKCERSYSKRKSLYLFQLVYIQLQSAVSSVTSWKHTVQAALSKKKEKKRASKEERGKENDMEKGEGNERGGKEEKKKKGMERVCA